MSQLDDWDEKSRMLKAVAEATAQLPPPKWIREVSRLDAESCRRDGAQQLLGAIGHLLAHGVAPAELAECVEWMGRVDARTKAILSGVPEAPPETPAEPAKVLSLVPHVPVDTLIEAYRDDRIVVSMTPDMRGGEIPVELHTVELGDLEGDDDGDAA